MNPATRQREREKGKKDMKVKYLGSFASDHMTTQARFLSLWMSSFIACLWFCKRPLLKPSRATPENFEVKYWKIVNHSLWGFEEWGNISKCSYDNTYKDLTYNINKSNIKFVFLITTLCKVIYKLNQVQV